MQISIILLFISTLFFPACTNQSLPDSVYGTYTGNNRIVSRYQKDGQYIFYEDNIDVILEIDVNHMVTGRTGGAVFENCRLVKNRGWIARQLNIKTDYLITGKLLGNTFGKDSIKEKEISIPFDIKGGELKGSLFLTNKGQNIPVISFLKLKKL